LEVPWALGPPDGRYPLREAPDASPTHVVVLRSELPDPRSWRRRRAEPAPELHLTQATVIAVGEPVDRAEAEAWLRQAGETDIVAGLDVLERVLHAYRLAAADPRLPSLARAQVLVARVGYGTGAELADGRFSEARELGVATPGRPRRRMLAPDGRVAAILVGRDQPLVCEELALRARLDLDRGRGRLAALGLLVALDAALAELGAESGRGLVADVDADAARRLAELRADREPVTAAAQHALSGELDSAARQAVAAALARLEAALRARTARRL
jgi:hypothetical protein